MALKDFEETQRAIASTKNAIECVFRKVGEFKILDENLVPYGLKPIARSISWLVEQIIVQNLKRYKEDCGFVDVQDPPHGLTQYDCILTLKDNDMKCHVNIKTSLTMTDDTGNFDISKADKLIKLYEQIPDIILLIAIAKVSIKGVSVKFAEPVVFNVAWVPTIYYNRANHNLQSNASGPQKPRSNAEFVKELKHKMSLAGHLKHY